MLAIAPRARKFSGQAEGDARSAGDQRQVGRRGADLDQVVVIDRVDDDQPLAARLGLGQRGAIALRPFRTTGAATWPMSDLLCSASQRLRSGSVIGVSGCFSMPLSLSSRSPTKRWPLKIERLSDG